MQNLFNIFLAIIVCCVIAGCKRSNRPDGLPPLYPCSVVIKQDDKPLPGATVLFINQENDEWTVSGTTNTTGTADISTQGQFPGAPLGVYKIIVRANLSEGGRSANEYSHTPETKIYSLVELNYTKPETTTLKLTVEKKQNHASFDLGSPVRILVDTIKPGT
ncbi:MAG: carboxypeptidase-like regulatory domain-containing protein [Thermoguttaceae bacterium]